MKQKIIKKKYKLKIVKKAYRGTINGKTKNKKNKCATIGLSFLAGVTNGLFGGGAGMLVVVLLQKVFGLNVKQSHASAVFIILPLCILSVVFYVFTGNFSFNNAYFVVLGVTLGGLIGATLLAKLNVKIVRLLFACVVIFCAFKLILA